VIFIVVKFLVKPEHVDGWLELVAPFTEATRAEPGNLWFEWSRSVDTPNEFVLVEAFHDGDAGRVHVESEHFAAAIAAMPDALLETPKIVSQLVDQDGWSEMGEVTVTP
jgi:quinol monooxygenase YgiN